MTNNGVIIQSLLNITTICPQKMVFLDQLKKEKKHGRFQTLNCNTLRIGTHGFWCCFKQPLYSWKSSLNAVVCGNVFKFCFNILILHIEYLQKKKNEALKVSFGRLLIRQCWTSSAGSGNSSAFDPAWKSGSLKKYIFISICPLIRAIPPNHPENAWSNSPFWAFLYFLYFLSYLYFLYFLKILYFLCYLCFLYFF